MSKENNGGPAFPCYDDTKGFRPGGMSLRDYFAVHATEEDVLYYYRHDISCKTRQQARYMHADEMLKAREE